MQWLRSSGKQQDDHSQATGKPRSLQERPHCDAETFAMRAHMHHAGECFENKGEELGHRAVTVLESRECSFSLASLTEGVGILALHPIFNTIMISNLITLLFLVWVHVRDP